MKRIYNILVWLTLGVVALLGVGCERDVSFQTSIVLKSWSQESSGKEQHPVRDVVMYGFAADTTLFTVANYEDALAGVMTSKSDPSHRISAELSGVPCSVEGYGEALMMPAPNYQSLIILVVNREDRLFGYVQQALVENLPYLYISVQFQPWKEAESYKNGQWWMFNDFYVGKIGCTVRPKIQHLEGDDPQYLTNSRLFAYAVEDPEAWAPIDWENAEVGRITHTSGAIMDPTYSFSADSQGNLAAKVLPGTYLLMVVNSTEKCYALRPITEEEIRAEEESDKEDKGFEVIFPFWNLDSPQQTETGWLCHYTPAISATVVTTIQPRYNESAKPLTGSTLYAYPSISSEEWLPLSLADASAGLLSHRTTGEQLKPAYEYSFEDQNSLQFSVPLGDYLLMTVNEEESCYALRDFVKSQAGELFQLNFPIAKSNFPLLDEQGWDIYYTPNLKGSINTYIERNDPNQPEPEPEPSSFPHYPGTPDPISGERIFQSVLHAYQVEDPELWAPRNMADARDGILTNTQSGERITAAHSFTANNSGVISPDLPHGDYLLLVSNYENGCYALRSWSSAKKTINASILFPIWRSDLPITDSAGWRIHYAPNVRAEITVSVQLGADQSPEPLDCNYLYAYQVENPSEWVPLSLEDALEGRLVNTTTGQAAPIFYAYESGRDESTLSVDFLQGNYLILVANTYGCCALHTLSIDQTFVELPLVFPLWRIDSPFTDEAGWLVYNWYEAPEPENPETPETTETVHR